MHGLAEEAGWRLMHLQQRPQLVLLAGLELDGPSELP